MGKGINKVILVANVGEDPEIRYSQSGTAMATVSMATSERWKDKQSGDQQERTEWHRVKFFGRLAEIVGEYVKKGGQIYVEGKLRTDKYTDKQGVERYSTDIIAEEMQLLGGRVKSEGGSSNQGSGGSRAGSNAPRSGGGGYGGGSNESRGSSNQMPPSRNDDPFPEDPEDIPF